MNKLQGLKVYLFQINKYSGEVKINFLTDQKLFPSDEWSCGSRVAVRQNDGVARWLANDCVDGVLDGTKSAPVLTEIIDWGS